MCAQLKNTDEVNMYSTRRFDSWDKRQFFGGWVGGGVSDCGFEISAGDGFPMDFLSSFSVRRLISHRFLPSILALRRNRSRFRQKYINGFRLSVNLYTVLRTPTPSTTRSNINNTRPATSRATYRIPRKPIVR